MDQQLTNSQTNAPSAAANARSQKTAAHSQAGISSVKRIAVIGLMGALSSVLMMVFKFPLPFMPPFMDFDLSGLVEIIGGFLLGPVAVVLIILIKLLIKLAIMGSGSAFTGEIQNFMLSCAYAVPPAILYWHSKSKKSGEIGMAIGTVLCAAVAVVTNLYMIIPFYVTLFGMTMDDIIAMCSAVNPLMKNAFTLALFGIVPFNLIKCGVSSVITVLVYKKISKPLKSFMG